MTTSWEFDPADCADHLLRKRVLKLRWAGMHAEAALLEDEYRRLGRPELIPSKSREFPHGQREAA